MYKRIALNGLAIVSLAFGAAAHAEFTPGFYAGASLGEGSIDVSGIDESDTALKVFGGYMFSEHFGVEAAYIDGGSVKKRTAFEFVSLDTSILNASAIGRYALNDAFTLFGKAGLAKYEVDGVVRVDNGFFEITAPVDDSGTELSFGVGGEYSFGQFGLRAEYEVIEDFTMLSVGGVFKF
jgi:OmpA-OmpF porin, OOP family